MCRFGLPLGLLGPVLLTHVAVAASTLLAVRDANDLAEYPVDVRQAVEETRKFREASVALDGKQIGIKDIVLGPIGERLKGQLRQSKCHSIEQIPTGVSQGTLSAVRTKWNPIVTSYEICTLTTTVLSRNAEVVLLRMGDVVAEIGFVIDIGTNAQDLDAALSERFGAARVITEITSREKIRSQTLDRLFLVCETVGPTFGVSVESCKQDAPRIADGEAAQIPATGREKKMWRWVVAGADVSMEFGDHASKAVVGFGAPGLEEFLNDLGRRISLEIKEREKARAKRDF